MCSNSSSHITTHFSSCSVVTHTISQLPQRLTVRGPDNHFTTVQAVSVGYDRRKPQDGGDQWYTLPVSILDSSSGAPVNSVVALQGDQLAPTDGVMVCYLSVTVVDQQSQGRAGTATPATHSIERNSEYAVNGRASFRMCFYVAKTSYLISVGVVCVQDEEGVECMGYNVDQYTTVITTARMGKRNAFNSPPLLKLEGHLTSKRFQKLMATLTNLFYRYKDDEIDKLVSMVSSSDNVSLDIKLYLSLKHLLAYPLDIVEVEKILRKCQSLNCQNGHLLQTHAMLTLAFSYLHIDGDHEKALECIHESKSLCFTAAPSYTTSWIFYMEACTLIKQHEGSITPSIMKKILELFDHAIDHSYYGTGWERYMMCFCHINKALLCLNGTFYPKFNPTSNYTPTEEDISLAEQHLNAVPVDQLSKLTGIEAQYHIALSDMNRLRGETTIAIQLAEQAKQLCAKVGKPCQCVDDRLQYLQSDLIDTMLAEYEDQV